MTRLPFILILVVLTSCKTTKQTTTYEEVNSGQGLEKVALISFDNFFNKWVFNSRVGKVDLNIQELNKDNQFTYFGKPGLGLARIKWTFFKVHTDTLTERFPNYKYFYGEELKNYLWTEVIPKEDMALWNYGSFLQDKIKPNCPYKKNKPIFKYSLIDKIVVLTMAWEVECRELERLKNKTYKASYNLLTYEYGNNGNE